ncbi:hypothetical protein [Gilliamella sp. wkB112]|uniref:hypothetical protein n=1 Tax=Gilliamella sp. wkB112 TaxID=3120257 RepID=UPI00080DB605|nr:hypothetical protein [Gilliamella apicola]OCG01099.1 hypothetical protein A9G12_00635 [Gilliamella apicola]
MIKDFKLIYNKMQTKTVLDRLPLAVSWTFENKQYILESEDKIIATCLKNRKEIAIVIAPFNIQKNKAIIINEDKTIKWDVSNLLKENKRTSCSIFSDVYYVLDELNFFINEDNSYDFKFSFDSSTGKLGDLIQCK